MGKKWWYGIGMAGLLSLAGMGSATIEPELIVPTPAAPGLRTFSSGGHALGFGAEGYLVAGMDHALRVRFAGARAIEPQTPNPAESAATGKAPPLQKVSYLGLWPGVDLHYSPQGGLLQSLYRIAPGAEVSAIALDYNVPLQIQTDGSLRLAFERGALTESAPIAWQEIAGERVPVEVAFEARSEKRLGFRVGNYDTARPLIIDPSLSWNTFLGSSGGDGAYGVALDASGNVYVTGDSSFTWGSPLRPFSGAGGFRGDAFVAKLSLDGTLLWNTFLGGDESEVGTRIALDAGGNIFVAGNSYASWGNPVRAHSSYSQDAFVAKLDANGALLWNTFLGASGWDYGRGIAVGSAGTLYVAGSSQQTWGNPVRAHSGSEDAFVAKLDANGALLWNTFLGGGGGDCYSGCAITADNGGNVYVTGDSNGTWGSPLRAYSGGTCGTSPCFDAFVAKVDLNGALLWNTFLGGSGSDFGSGVSLGAWGNLFVGGTSYASWGNPVQPYSGAYNGFVAELSSDGALLWNTFFGGGGSTCEAVVVATDGNLYVTGLSAGTWGNPVWPFSGTYYYDAYVAKIDAEGALLWNGFLGSSIEDRGQNIALHVSGKLYAVGYSRTTWGSPLRAFSAGTCGVSPNTYPCSDAFVAKISDSDTTAKRRSDFDGDGNADILWRNTATGENWLYLMDGNIIQISAGINQVADPNWKIVGIDNFDGDGKADILWRNSATGENWLYLMDGFDILESHPVNIVSDLNWKIVSVDDFDGDHKADILWRNAATGENWLYLMDGANILESAPINTVSDLNWKIAGVGDFDGDGQADILWRNSATGQNWLYLMDGASIDVSQSIDTVSNLDWKIVGVADFDGDGKADILWRNSATGENWLYLMDGASIHGSYPIDTVANLNWQIQGGQEN